MTDAYLYFHNISSLNSAQNSLFVHLLDTDLIDFKIQSDKNIIKDDFKKEGYFCVNGIWEANNLILNTSLI